MAFTADDVARRYPIHWLVWHNQYEELKTQLEANKVSQEELESKDCRGRTPLLLAVTLGHLETTRVLIEAGADVNCEKDGWTAVQEATATGNPELLSLVLSRRDYQRHVLRSGGIPDLLRRLSLAPDFYVEMKWEFTSWVPLVSRMCPFDTYKVYKRGGNVRVDTTLVGFDNNRWQRGDRTYIFRGQGRTASLMELDHELGTSWCEYLEPLSGDREWPAPPPHVIEQRLAAPLAINYLDTDKISFERNKSGIWGWRQDKTEPVNGYECKVFGANNVELVSKTRTEHVPRGERRPAARAPLAGLLALADADAPSEPLLPVDRPLQDESPSPRSSRSSEQLAPVSWQEYFSDRELERDIGRPREVATKVQKFRATLWLCEDYPLELQEQIMPILDLMAAISSPHFAKLKDFVQMQLPAGFPVKIEIPLFHVLNARITFGNIFATESPVPHIECVRTGAKLACLVDDACFALGRAYRPAAGPDERAGLDDEEGLLQYAIQQSLMETGTQDDQVSLLYLNYNIQDIFALGRAYRPAAGPDERAGLDDEEGLLQYAIQQSLMETGTQDDQVSLLYLNYNIQDIFALGRAYRPAAGPDERAGLDDEEGLLQYAIQQSLMETGTQDDQVSLLYLNYNIQDIFSLGRAYRPAAGPDERAGLDDEEGLLQYAIQQSLMETGTQDDQVSLLYLNYNIQDIFALGRAYRPAAGPDERAGLDDEEGLLQYAIQQSLMETGTQDDQVSLLYLNYNIQDIFALGRAYRPAAGPDERAGLDDEEGLLQYAIQQSLMETGTQDDQVSLLYLNYNIQDIFALGRAYRPAAGPDKRAGLDDEEGLLQYAIQQSLMETGTQDDQVSLLYLNYNIQDIFALGRAYRPAAGPDERAGLDDEEGLLQYAIQQSLMETGTQDDQVSLLYLNYNIQDIFALGRAYWPAAGPDERAGLDDEEGLLQYAIQQSLMETGTQDDQVSLLYLNYNIQDIFALGRAYRPAAGPDERAGLDDEEGLLQYAIQQSLMETGTQDDQVSLLYLNYNIQDIFALGRAYRPAAGPDERAGLDDEEGLLQYAIQQSLMETGTQDDQVSLLYLNYNIQDIFALGRAYRPAAGPDERAGLDDEEGLLQYAIQQSLMETGTQDDQVSLLYLNYNIQDIFALGRAYRPAAGPDERAGLDDEEGLLQYAIQQSLMETGTQDDQVSLLYLNYNIQDIFALGRAYRPAAGPDERAGLDDEEGLLQYAIQQSLMETGTQDDQVDVWEALRGARPASPCPARMPDTHLLASEERQLQRAIEASLATISLNSTTPEDLEEHIADADADADLQAALALSAREQANFEQQLAAEQDAFDEALRLSLLDK